MEQHLPSGCSVAARQQEPEAAITWSGAMVMVVMVTLMVVMAEQHTVRSVMVLILS